VEDERTDGGGGGRRSAVPALGPAFSAADS